MDKSSQQKVFIVEPNYFSNWVDQFMPPLANKLLPLILPFKIFTPNVLTLLSFLLHLIGSASLFIQYPNHVIVSAVLLPLSYILDCMDGQVARIKNMQSELGNYLDKTLDVLKIYVINLALGVAVYLQTQNVIWIILGFTSCFFFMFRYYLKHETIFSQFNKDPEYLKKSKAVRLELYEQLDKKHHELRKSFFGTLKSLLIKNKILFFLDEGEFIFFTSIFALFNRLDLILIIFALINTIVGLFRLVERGHQTVTNSKNLLLPMRK